MHIPTFGVIVHGIKVSTINVTEMASLTERWQTENAVLYGKLDIKHVSWLCREPKGQHSSLVLALGSRAKRDEIVAKNRLYWQDTPHQVEKYDLALRILQCLKCCKYGHTIAQCRSPTPVCNYCSEQHLGTNCPNKADPTAKKCALCKGQHAAFAKCCKHRIEQEQKKATLKALRPRHWPQPASPTAPTIQQSTTITPQNTSTTDRIPSSVPPSTTKTPNSLPPRTPRSRKEEKVATVNKDASTITLAPAQKRSRPASNEYHSQMLPPTPVKQRCSTTTKSPSTSTKTVRHRTTQNQEKSRQTSRTATGNVSSTASLNEQTDRNLTKARLTRSSPAILSNDEIANAGTDTSSNPAGSSRSNSTSGFSL